MKTPTDVRRCTECGHVLAAGVPSLTTRQAQVLAVLQSVIAQRGYPPTFRELGEMLDMKSDATVYEHLETLEAKGYIRRQFNRPQSIEILVQHQVHAG